MTLHVPPYLPPAHLHGFSRTIRPQGVTRDREGYALAAGLALGLITLGRGRSAAGQAALQLGERLR